MAAALTLTRPDDWHLHLRDGAAMAAVLPATARQFARAIVMPNLKPPITTAAMAAAYRERVESYNGALRDICREAGVGFIDLYPAFLAADGSLRDELTFDELHLNGAGYRRWRELLLPYLHP